MLGDVNFYSIIEHKSRQTSKDVKDPITLSISLIYTDRIHQMFRCTWNT